MKKLKMLILAVLLITMAMQMGYPDNIFAERVVTVTVNGEVIQFDEPARLINARTMVPMRKIYETLGATVQWVDEAQLIIATFKTSIIAMEIGKNSFDITELLTGETRKIDLDVPPQVVGIGTTLVPVRAISEALGKNVDWDDKTSTVIITDN
ncbi:MAG: copper amine oxidase N-terminal domain-containing protein [Ruminococcaceae bacterium]|nr:copper amine oxidase N-terminal domain-containing protein [Oscillospiraceae bacterium]